MAGPGKGPGSQDRSKSLTNKAFFSVTDSWLAENRSFGTEDQAEGQASSLHAGHQTSDRAVSVPFTGS
jgi:hypothetical protein